MRREPQAQECFAVWLMACFKSAKLAKGELLSEREG